MSIATLKDGWFTLFDQGGITLWVILLVSILMWILILERYWFLVFELPKIQQAMLTEGRDKIRSSPDHHSFITRALALGFLSRCNQFLLPLQTMAGILPMLGLLGTVSGMIAVFEVITVFGTGNSRGMAAGISTALVTTLAGLLTALSGIYFISLIEKKIEGRVRHFKSLLDEGVKV